MKYKLYLTLFISSVSMIFTSCSTIEKEQYIEIDLTQSTNLPFRNWTMNKNEVTAQQSDEFHLTSGDANTLIYEYVGDEDIMQSYSFSDNGTLNASALIIPENSIRTLDITDELKKFEKRGTKGNAQVFSSEENSTAATLQTMKTANGQSYLVVGFSEYSSVTAPDEPNEPYVDLGLSVCWAKCNVGANSPEEFGDFYAWGEVTEKSEYWRENYKFCTQDGYNFNYHNPVNEISGTVYDAATKILGEDWQMPTKEQANELIHLCTWKSDTLNGVPGYTIIGPNGNSIFLPNTPYKYQDKKDQTYEIWTGSGRSKTSSEAYIIKFPTHFGGDVPQLNSYWKAWGHAIRPVYVNK